MSVSSDIKALLSGLKNEAQPGFFKTNFKVFEYLV